MRIIFIGPPGSGKGTQSVRLVSYLGVQHLSTGDMLRQAKEAGTELGKRVSPYMDGGNLVPDDLIVGVVGDRLDDADCQPGWLLDGFPRTVAQAEALDLYLAGRSQRIDCAVELSVPDRELVRRLLRRATQDPNPRADDSPEAIPHRLEVYHSDTEPVLNYYRDQQLLATIDGLGTEDEVFERIRGCVDGRATRTP